MALLGGIEFKVEISIGLTQGEQYLYDAVDSLYDAAVYASDDLYWIDLSARFLQATTHRGKDKWSDRFPPGSMTIDFADEDGIFNPDTGALQLGPLDLRPGRWVRISGREDPLAEWEPMWTGRIDSIRETFATGGSDIVAQFQCTDLQTWLNRFREPALPEDVGVGERTDQRVYRILDLADYPVAGLNPLTDYLDIGVNTMQGTKLIRNYGEEAQRAADAEGGAFYWNRDGTPRFRAQNWIEAPAVDLSIGQPTSEIQVINVPSLSWGVGFVRNNVQLARVNGTVQRVISSASISAYQPRTFQYFDLDNSTDAQVYTLAERMVEWNQWDTARFGELSLIPKTPAAARQLMQLDPGAKMLLQVRTLRGWDYTIEAYLLRVSHQVTADDWEIRVVVENLDRSQPGKGGPFDALAFSDAYRKPEVTP